MSYIFLISVYSGYSTGLDYGNTNVNSYLPPRIGFQFASLVPRYDWNWISISYIQYSRGWFSSTSFRKRQNIHKFWALWFIWAFFSWPPLIISPPWQTAYRRISTCTQCKTERSTLHRLHNKCPEVPTSARKYFTLPAKLEVLPRNNPGPLSLLLWHCWFIGWASALIPPEGSWQSPSVLAALFIIHKRLSFNSVIRKRVL